MSDNQALDNIIQDQIQETVPQMIQDAINTHTHNGSDSAQLQASQAIVGAPASAIPVASGGALSTGGSAVLSTADSTILANAIARIAALESQLQSLELSN